jgi:hypothetical protein
MSHSAVTDFKQLPQIDAEDKPTWLGDFNGAMLKIDQAFSAQQALISALQNRCTVLESDNASQAARLTALEA